MKNNAQASTHFEPQAHPNRQNPSPPPEPEDPIELKPHSPRPSQPQPSLKSKTPALVFQKSCCDLRTFCIGCAEFNGAIAKVQWSGMCQASRVTAIAMSAASSGCNPAAPPANAARKATACVLDTTGWPTLPTAAANASLPQK